MKVRFRLLRSSDSGASWTELSGGGLGAWEAWYAASKHPYLTKTFTGLGTAVQYRSDVDFVWADSQKRQLKAQTIRSSACSQPDLRPDLEISAVSAAAVPPSSLRWSLTVRNVGKGRSASGRVSILIGTKRYPTGTGVLVGPIDQQGTKRTATKADPLVLQRTVTVVTPKCAEGGTALAQFNPDNVLDDSNPGNDLYPTLLDCSRPTGSG